jgi:hypothetical protein
MRFCRLHGLKSQMIDVIAILNCLFDNAQLKA